MELSQIRNYRENGRNILNYRVYLIIANIRLRIACRIFIYPKLEGLYLVTPNEGNEMPHNMGFSLKRAQQKYNHYHTRLIQLVLLAFR